MSEEEIKKEQMDSIEESPEEQLANDEISPEEEAFEKGAEEAAEENLEEPKEEAEEKSEEQEEKKTEEKEEKKQKPVINNNKKAAPMIGESSSIAGASLPSMKGTLEIVEEEPEEEVEEEKEEPKEEIAQNTHIYALRTTANREEQVMDFVSSNAARKKLDVYSVISPHGMRGYIFLEAINRQEAEQAAYGVPYAKGILPNEIQYEEIEHMLEQVKKEVNIQKNDIAEILTGPFKREKCKITRIDKTKDEVVVELLEAAVPIPITLKLDAVKVIRRETNKE